MGIRAIGSGLSASDAGGIDANAGSEKSSAGDVVSKFLDYMKESPIQRAIDAWLKAHGLTEDDLKKMSPDKREAIEKQMTADIKNAMEKRAKDEAAQSTTAAVGGQSGTVSSSLSVHVMSTLLAGNSASTPSDAPTAQSQLKKEGSIF